MSPESVQKFSIFHDIGMDDLKHWHRPYAVLFQPFSPVLDVGCGPMYFADLLQEFQVHSVGLDVDPEMVRLAASRGHQAFHGDHHWLQGHAGEFGGIHISHVVEHLWGDELTELLESSFEALQPAGLLVIRTPNWQVRYVREHLFWMDHTHKRPYPRQLLDRMLTDIGFEVLQTGCEPTGMQDLFVIAAKPPVDSKRVLKVEFEPVPRLGLMGRIRRRLRMHLRSFLELD